MADQVEVTAAKVNGAAPEVFKRASWAEARSLATELEKEGLIVHLDGFPFLNAAGPDGRYLHQTASECPKCEKYSGCARCPSLGGKYLSVKPTHYHSRQIEGVSGHTGVHDTLCYDCHRKDRYEVYGEGYGEAVA